MTPSRASAIAGAAFAALAVIIGCNNVTESDDDLAGTSEGGGEHSPADSGAADPDDGVDGDDDGDDGDDGGPPPPPDDDDGDDGDDSDDHDTGAPVDPGAARPSPGCGGTTVAPGEHLGMTIEHDGASRSYDLFVPPAHDGTTPIPLVLNFHGLGGNPGQHENASHMDATSAARGFAVVFPAGVGSSWNAGLCCGTAKNQGVDDVGFVRALVGQIGATLCIDERRVYATGFSNGGFLTHRLGCEASDLFAAIGPVSGPLGIPPETCTPGRAVPVMHMHGDADSIVPYDGGGLTGHGPIPATMSGWAARNGCDPVSVVTLQIDDVTCETWAGCNDDVEVTLCTIDGGGHCWPGQDSVCLTGTATQTIDGSEALATFFESYVLPE